jgi:hypothetical protein
MLFPANTDEGVAAVLSARSACVAVATTTVAVAEFAPKDWLVALTVAVSVIVVPLGVSALTVYLTVNVADAPPATPAAFWQLTGGGAGVQVHPAGGVIDTNAVLAGVASVNVAPVAVEVPVFVTTWV